jgi:hypothetical protein
MKERSDDLAVVAPTTTAARGAAAWLERREGRRALPYSLATYLASGRAPSRIVLCPAGRSLAADIAFLREVSRRALWPPPDEILAEAIEGFRGSHGQDAAIRPASGRGTSASKIEKTSEALLLEGIVTSARARSLAAERAGLWIVESPRHVRVDRRLRDRIDRIGVRWAALEPVNVAAVLASPKLARALPRWGRLLAPGTAVWIRKPARRRS